jgi:hypothetical protein
MQNDPFYMENHVALMDSSILQPNAHYTVYLLRIFLYQSLLHVTVCYNPSSGRTSYPCSKMSAFYRLLHNSVVNNKLYHFLDKQCSLQRPQTIYSLLFRILEPKNIQNPYLQHVNMCRLWLATAFILCMVLWQYMKTRILIIYRF